MPANRRRYPRVAVRARCWCESDGITLYAKITNVSEGGVFIHTFAPLSRGAPARIRFALAQGEPEVNAQAEVVWVREASEDPQATPGMGMRFVTIDDQSCDLLRTLIGRTQK